jgi:hypothetical protein
VWVCVCVSVSVSVSMRDVENSKSGGLDLSWAVAPQKEKNDEFVGILNSRFGHFRV